MQALATLALIAALAGASPYRAAAPYVAPPTPHAVYQLQRDRGDEPEPTRWELRETLREAGDRDPYR